MPAEERRGSVTVRTRENLLDKLPGDVLYLFPEFRQADIYRNDGGMSSGVVNVCLVDNSIRFISDNGDTLLMSKLAFVNRIIAGEEIYVPVAGEFVQQLAVFGPVSLAFRTHLELDQSSDKSTGGITSPPTSTAVTANVMALDPSRRFEATTVVDYTLSTGYVLTDGERLYPARQSSFAKLFPASKKSIKGYVKEHAVDFDNKDDLKALFMFCAQGQQQ